EPGGAPSPSAWVNWFNSRSRFPLGMGINTDENGRFHVDRPRADLPESFDVSAINGGRTGKTAVQPGQTEVTVQLLPAATLRGHLSTGKVDSFQVDLAPTQESDFPGFAARTSLEFTGDRFEIRDVPGSKMHLTVRTSDGRSAQLDVTLVPGAAQDVEVPLQDNAAISGRLIDSATRQPLPDVHLFVDRSLEGGGSLTGGDGRFKLSAGSGDHTLRFLLPQGYKSLSKSFTLQPAQQLDLGEVIAEKQGADPGTIGVRLRSDSESPPTIIYVLPESPADRAGLHIGDQVIAVDGAKVMGWADATQKIKGAPGTPVQLTIRRNGAEQQTLTVTRAS
ncbi:MAG TPA: PDZ domain-containing protein, partial [Myxococcales bacterium]